MCQRGFNSYVAVMSEQHFGTVIYYERCQKHSKSAATAIIITHSAKLPYPKKLNHWFNRLALGDTSFEDNERPGRAFTVNDDELLRCIKANPEATTRELAATLGCCQRTIVTHLNSLGCRKGMC